jgi:hypothetical protein
MFFLNFFKKFYKFLEKSYLNFIVFRTVTYQKEKRDEEAVLSEKREKQTEVWSLGAMQTS